jgi:hypothetical protein
MSWGRLLSYYTVSDPLKSRYKEKKVQEKCARAMIWLKDRVSEPSSWASVAAVLLGFGVLISSGMLMMASIIVAVLGFVLKEKGLI